MSYPPVLRDKIFHKFIAGKTENKSKDLDNYFLFVNSLMKEEFVLRLIREGTNDEGKPINYDFLFEGVYVNLGIKILDFYDKHLKLPPDIFFENISKHIINTMKIYIQEGFINKNSKIVEHYKDDILRFFGFNIEKLIEDNDKYMSTD
jgi:hypothetical protein